MTSHQHFPATTQSRSRYGASPAGTHTSSLYTPANTTFGQKSALSVYGNTSFNTTASFARPGTSLLYTSNKPKPITSRNSWKHTFSIPVECGKRGAHSTRDMELFADPHLTKLAPTNNRRIVCGGLQWDIYIHPNQGESSCEFALSVFPVKTSPNDAIPENYRLRYAVTAAVKSNSRRDGANDRDDHKSAHSNLDSEWTREIEDIVYDAQPADSHALALAGQGQQSTENANKPQIDWRSTMERLSFSTQDLLASNIDDEDYFDLEIAIRTEFVRKAAKRSAYHGVVGAILLQSEATIAAQETTIDALDRKKDAFVQSLQSQLKQSNELNRAMVLSMDKLAECQSDMQREMGAITLETQKLCTREKHAAVEKEKAINRLQEQNVADKDEIQRLMLMTAKLKQQLASAAQYAQLEQLLQTQMHVQAQAMAQTVPMQPMSVNPMQQQNAAVHALRQQQMQQHSLAQQQQMQQQQLLQQQQMAVPPSMEVPPPTHNYGAFPSSNVVDASPQRTENVTVASSYQPRVISQPAFESYQPISPAVPPMPAQNQHIPTLEADTGDASPNFQFESSPMGDHNHNHVSAFGSLPALDNGQSKEEREVFTASPAKGASEELQTPDALRTQSQSETFDVSGVTSQTQTQSVSQTPIDASEIMISDNIDYSVEEQLFSHRPVRGWRWDADQKKWRGRGKGTLSVYYHREKGVAKLLFVDEKHDKTRLTQWIDGEADQRSELVVDAEMRVLETEVEWAGADYTMCANPETPEPMVGKWKVQFTDNAAQASAFRELFNHHIDVFHGTQQKEENEDTMSGATKPFTFEHAEQPKIDSFGASGGFSGGSGLNDATASNWASSFGNEKKSATDEESKETANTDSNSFGNINWSFGNDKPAAAAVSAPVQSSVTKKPATTEKKKAAEEDNGADYTFKAIVHLEEVEVGSGHENETLMAKVEYLKLYRFGKDVSGCPCWKNRGTRSEIFFYAHNETGKVRLISREQITNKLRMNQRVPKESNAHFTLKQARVYSWNAYDVTIAAEEEDEAAGMCAWSIKFETETAAEDFAHHFQDAMQRNANAVSSPKKADTPELLESLDNEKEKETVEEAVVEKEETPEAERYLGWREEEIMADKVRRQKAKKDAKAAALFSSGDSANQKTSWDMGAFDANAGANGDEATVTNMFAAVDFEAQRGVDLQAEAVLNRIAVDPSISFGIGGGNDADGDGNGASGLGLDGNFSFDGGDADANDTATSNSWGAAATTTTEAKEETEKAASNGWGGFSGGFSDVAVTDGFGNASWGAGAKADGDSGGFGSFGNNADFNVEAIQKDSAAKPAVVGSESGATEADGDDNGTYTLAPIVQLREVDVNSGHEEERELDGFEVAKLYRWGKDVTGDYIWKQRASNTKLQFWQNNASGKIRIVCRENVTSKLRLNQIVDTKQLGEVIKMSAKQSSWVARDVTIEAEDEDELQGVCKFACKFINAETATEFVKMFTSSGENNATVG